MAAIEKLKRGARVQWPIRGQVIKRVSLGWVGEHAARDVFGIDVK